MSTTLAELLQAHYGVKTRKQWEKAKTISNVSPTKVLEYNPNRLSVLIVNNGAQDVWVAPNRDVDVSKGIRLVSGGGSFSLVWNEDFELVASEWYGQAAAAGSSDVSIIEVLSI